MRCPKRPHFYNGVILGAYQNVLFVDFYCLVTMDKNYDHLGTYFVSSYELFHCYYIKLVTICNTIVSLGTNMCFSIPFKIWMRISFPQPLCLPPETSPEKTGVVIC